jgi:signal peptidase I
MKEIFRNYFSKIPVFLTVIFFLAAGFAGVYGAFILFKVNSKPLVSDNHAAPLAATPETGVQPPTVSCAVDKRTEEVRGNSLSGFIESGTAVQALFGYYSCHDVARNDVVLFYWAGDANPLIKIVKGIPGDTFHLTKANGGWNMLLNGAVLKTTRGEPYLLGDQGYRMLSLYEHDYHGEIPPDAYLILGNLPSGSTDSTRFGFGGKKDILAKVLY